jgi:Ca2+/Na+ antiporter
LYCLFLLTIVFSFSVDHCIVFFCWPLYCLFLLTLVLSFRKRQYNVQQKNTIQWPTGKDNTRVNRKRQYKGQQKKTIQWSTEKDNTYCPFLLTIVVSFLSVMASGHLHFCFKTL